MRLKLFDLTVAATTLALLAFFGWHGAYGDRGIHNQARIDRDVARHKLTRDEIRARRKKLERRVALLRPEAVDPDLIEELARTTLGYARADEIVILLDKND